MQDAAVILARRTPTDILLAEGAIAVPCAWNGLASRDGAEMRVEWTPRVTAVDSPADRELLGEHFLSAGVGATLSASGIAQHLERTIAAALRRAISEHDAASLLRGEHDVALSESLQAEAKRAAFSVGLAVLPPFVLRVESPSVERDRRLAETKARLAEMAELDNARARSIATLAQTLGGLPDARRAAQVIADLRLGDPLDLLRAAAISDPAWSVPAPSLWIAAGDRLVAVDPTRPAVDVATAIRIDGIGPLRSVRDATLAGRDVLLVGGRSGIAIVDPASRQVTVRAPLETGSEFGFNSATIVEEDGLLLATHSAAGLCAWTLDGSPRPLASNGLAVPITAARSIVGCGRQAAAFVADGRIATFSTARGIAFDPSAPREVAELIRIAEERSVLALGADGRTSRADEASLASGAGTWTPARGSGCNASSGIASLELCGTTRLATIGPDASVRLCDADRDGDVLPIGTPRIGARLVRARPGFVALLSADRGRVLLVDLAKPDAIAADLHVAIVLGNRAADCWFA